MQTVVLPPRPNSAAVLLDSQALLSSCQYFLTLSRGLSQTWLLGLRTLLDIGLRAAPGAITASALIGDGSGRTGLPFDSVLCVQACVHAQAIARGKLTREHVSMSV